MRVRVGVRVRVRVMDSDDFAANKGYCQGQCYAFGCWKLSLR